MRLLRRTMFEEDQDGTFDASLIRTYLANERTFLAWLRTAVVLVGVGLGAVALGGRDDASSALAFSLGGVTVFAAIVVAVWAYVSFCSTIAEIEQRRYRPTGALVAVASPLVIITGAVVLSVLTVEVLN